MKAFIFLYPISRYIDNEIKNNAYGQKGGEEVFRQKCQKLLNQCIDLRYRQNGWPICYALFNDCVISDLIRLHPADKIIKVGLDFKTHTAQRPDKIFPYPDEDFILDQMGPVDTVRVAGFHIWDCAEKLARRAYERGLKTLIDEDLTEFFFWRIKSQDFALDHFPSFNPKNMNPRLFAEFMAARKIRPWLWQEYQHY